MAQPSEEELDRILKLKEARRKLINRQGLKSIRIKEELLDENGKIISTCVPERKQQKYDIDIDLRQNKESHHDKDLLTEQSNNLTQDMSESSVKTEVYELNDPVFGDSNDVLVSEVKEYVYELGDSDNDTFREQVLADLNAFLQKEDNELFFNERDFQMHLSLYLRHTGHYDDVDIEYFIPYLVFGDDYIWKNQLYLDIVLRKGNLYIPIELKYPTKRVMRKIKRFGELLEDDVEIVKNQGAQNLVAYNFWKDVRRLELVKQKFANVKTGFAVMLTNDKSYQQQRRDGANSEEMSMVEGLHGCSRKWHRAPASGEDKPNFCLDNCYKIQWLDATPLEEEPFKYTIVEV